MLTPSNTSYNPIHITPEELAGIAPEKIFVGLRCESAEVEAQEITIECPSCKHKYWNAIEFQFTICPYCGYAVKWW